MRVRRPLQIRECGQIPRLSVYEKRQLQFLREL